VKKIYLHIGLEKTGTSAIQYFLKLNQYILKEKAKICIPQYRTKDTIHTHHRLAKSFFSKQGIAKKHKPYSTFELNHLLQLLQSNKIPNTIIISSELFAYLKEAEIKQLKKYLQDFEVCLILFLRRQDEYLEAQYAQHLKGIWAKGATPIQPEAFSVHNLDYEKFINKWKKFGFEDIKVKTYQITKNKNLIYNQFFEDINADIIDKNWVKFPVSLKNPSLSLFHLELIKNYVYKIKNDEIRKKIATLLFYHNNEEAEMKGSFVPNKQIFSDSFKIELLVQYEVSNKSVLGMYPEIGYNKVQLFQPFELSVATNSNINKQILVCIMMQIGFPFLVSFFAC